ncbi:MAG: cbb3-type cytochrome c oxidase subunit II [Salinisphaera sp.]|jgi:cytochrome c oxidase cbb3-type subunit 2|nr:cbb3-type cytochrome c oxidase subunit II [Salinisphaera sp.]
MNFHRNHWLLLGTIFFGFIFLGLIIAIGPAYWVQAKVNARPAPQSLTPLQQRGLDVYISEGCAACHTQQVRPIAMDRVWGRPSTSRDYAKLGGPMDVWRPYTPAVLGTERTGPDLANVGSRQPSKTWQYMHLYNPRSVVKPSIMPAFPWLFKVTDHPAVNTTAVPVPAPYAPSNGKVVPTERAKALVAYLLSLHQEAKTTRSPQKSAQAAAKGTAQESQPQAKKTTSSANGATLYSNNCASCHQADGGGLPGAFPSLAGDEVVTATDPTEHIDTVLNGAHGRTIDGKTYGASMPPFGSRFSDAKIAAIINHERTSWGNNAPTVTADDVAKQRAGGK